MLRSLSSIGRISPEAFRPSTTQFRGTWISPISIAAKTVWPQQLSETLACDIRKFGKVARLDSTFEPFFPITLRKELLGVYFVTNRWFAFTQLPRTRKVSRNMFSRISKNPKRILAILSQYRSPNQMAWGVAFGVILGLLPKDNLITIFMICSLAFLRVNQLTGVAVAIGLSLLSSWFAPLSINLGSFLLNQPSVANGVRGLYEIPIMPWTNLENPSVLGGMLIGLFSMPPTFVFCSLTFSRAKRLLETNQLRQIANDAIRYRKVVLDQSVSRRERTSSGFRVLTVTDESASSQPASRPPQNNLSVSLLPSRTSDTQAISNVFDKPNSANARSSRNFFPRLAFEESADSETILRETVIEVVRFRSPVNKDLTISCSPQDAESISSPTAPGNSMSVAPMPLSTPTANLTRVDDHSKGLAKYSNESNGTQETQTIFHPTNGEESLRYLISHINGTREQSRKIPGKSHDVA